VRLWSLHPGYLDSRGLVALWREGLLARAVLGGQVRGYRHHPQLERFRACTDPVAAVDAYLAAVCDEATRRGYRFDRAKLGAAEFAGTLSLGTQQLRYEWDHLQAKLAVRSPDLLARHAGVDMPACHPLFHLEPGPVAPWERVPARSR